MRYFSTRDTNIEKKTVSAAEAIVQGLAPDGGLYIPESVPQVDYRQFKNLSYLELAAAILPYYLDDYDAAVLKQAAESAYAENKDVIDKAVYYAKTGADFLSQWFTK